MTQPIQIVPSSDESQRLLDLLRRTRGKPRRSDSRSMPADVEHGAEVIEDAVAVEVFSPVREDCLPAQQERDR